MEESLPAGVVGRLVRQHLPPGTRCSQDTIRLLTECSSEFAKMLCSEATECCTRGAKSTIGGEHVLEALAKLDFTAYLQPIEAEQSKQQEQAQAKV